MPVTAIAGGLLGLGGSIGSAAIGSNAANDAASQQSQAAKYAADKQYQASQEALGFQKDQYAETQKNLAPWLDAGKSGLSSLQQLLGTAQNPGALLQGYGKQFTAPTGLDMQNDPGYQARLNLGTQAIERSAAARGNLLTGGTAKALNQFGQDYASNEYGNVYNRALTGYTTDYNQFQQNQANQYNRLGALAGIGQQTAGQLANAGQNTANNMSNTLMSGANAQANGINNAAAANASGIVGGANAWSGALGGATSNVSQMLMLQQLMGKQGGVKPTGGNSTGYTGGYAGRGVYTDNGMFVG